MTSSLIVSSATRLLFQFLILPQRPYQEDYCLELYIGDINDNRPVFNPPIARQVIEETSLVGHVVDLSNWKAMDADLGEFLIWCWYWGWFLGLFRVEWRDFVQATYKHINFFTCNWWWKLWFKTDAKTWWEVWIEVDEGSVDGG